MKEQIMIAKDFAFPSIQLMMYGAAVGTVAGIVIGLWLKNYVDRKSIEENDRMRKLPGATMTWYKKTGPLTSIWRMLGV
jgi:membrane protein YqaA with SNARE-associated domain